MYPQSTQQTQEAFWKALGQYMAPVPSASGEKLNWINYKTGTKKVRFILRVNNNVAKIAATVSDAAIMEKLISLKVLFSTIANKQWQWTDNEIFVELKGKDIRNKGDWPVLISFFKEQLIILDAFWVEIKDIII